MPKLLSWDSRACKSVCCCSVARNNARADGPRRVSSPTLRRKLVHQQLTAQYRNAGRVGLGPLPALSANKPAKRIDKCPTSSAAMRLVGRMLKTYGVSRLSQHWYSTGGANAKWPCRGACRTGSRGERQQLDTSTPACQRRRREECQIESGPGS